MKKTYKLFVEESNVNLLTVSSCHKGWFGKEAERIIGIKVNVAFCVYENDYLRVYLKENIVEKAGRIILELIKKKRNFFEETTRPIERLVKEAEGLKIKILRSRLERKDNKDLIKILVQCFENTAKLMDFGIVGVLSDMCDMQLSNRMAEIVAKRSLQSGKDYLLSLGMPNKLSPGQEAKLKLQKLSNLKLKREINKVLRDMPWIDYNYQGPEIDVREFYDLFAKKKSNIFDPKKMKKTQLEYEKELKLTKEENSYFENAREFGYQKALRVDARGMMCYCIDLILKEISRRTFYSLSQLRYALPDEIMMICKRHGLARHELDLRRKLSVVYIDSCGELKVLADKKAKQYIRDRVKVERINTGIKKFKGMIARSGKAEGEVKLINSAAEINKMEEGNILVAYSTTPEVVPAMKKAAAIVTEAGGITCHAAIVSREMGIPCVVGVKHISKILKDGDRIEVDATRGIVKKIKN